jgi:hypothetical protein
MSRTKVVRPNLAHFFISHRDVEGERGVVNPRAGKRLPVNTGGLLKDCPGRFQGNGVTSTNGC